MRLLPIMLLLLTASCVSAPPPARISEATPSFDAIRFFEGRTQGEGQVKVALSGPSWVKVQGQGTLQPDGVLVLDQLIERGGAEPERRQWRIWEVRPGTYRGTLTSAEGAVAGRAEGNRLHLRYRLKQGGLDVRQWIDLQPDGRTALNRLSLSRFGMRVGTLEETIRKID